MAGVSVVINGVTYSNCPEVDIPLSGGGGSAKFMYTGDADATASHILNGKKAYVNGAMVTGNIATKTSSDLSASTLTVTAPAGYYASAASKTLSDASLVSGNIKAGATIFGVSGATNVIDSTIASGAAGSANIISGYKAYANGSLVEGSATVPTVSQDSTSKILSIS